MTENYDVLLDAWKKERHSKELQPLQESFYGVMTEYISQLREQTRMMDKSSIKGRIAEKEKEYVEKMFRYEDEDGRKYRRRRGGKQYLDEKPGKIVGDIWNDIYSYQTRTRSKEYQGYPTQKPEKLLKRIILASSNEGDLVADFFCGSGTTLIVAKKLKRKWLGVDNNPSAIELSKKRLNLN